MKQNEQMKRPKILHVSDGWEETNGAAGIARLIAREQEETRAASVLLRRYASVREIVSADEIYLHCGWKPCLWWTALVSFFAKKKVVQWVPQACYDPKRLAYHAWKKIAVGWIERFCLRRMTTLVAMCVAEVQWIRDYVGANCPNIEINDPKRFFNLDAPRAARASRENENDIHLLFLGRRHPLKGVEILQRVVRELNDPRFILRCVSDAHGDEKERVWNWCDVLVLPTISDNFALVVAEALAHGKRVVVTDGAPAWENDSRVTYVRDFREGNDETRARVLRDALRSLVYESGSCT